MTHSQPQASDFIPLSSELPDDCGGCGNAERLGFQFAYAYQPIVDLASRRVFAHEALVRRPRGEGAMHDLDAGIPIRPAGVPGADSG